MSEISLEDAAYNSLTTEIHNIESQIRELILERETINNQMQKLKDRRRGLRIARTYYSCKKLPEESSWNKAIAREIEYINRTNEVSPH